MMHKISPVDRAILSDFLTTDDTPTNTQLHAVDRVLTIVLIKHFNKYLNDSQELRQQAMLELLEKRCNYDPSFSSFNYIYCIARNAIGNQLYRTSRELVVEDILPLDNSSVGPADPTRFNIPAGLESSLRVLGGVNDRVLHIPRAKALELLRFLFDRQGVDDITDKLLKIL